MNETAAPPARYHGPRGAVLYAAFLLVLSAVTCGLAFAVLWALTRNRDAATVFAVRAFIWAAATSVAAGLCRWLAGTRFDRFFSLKLDRGDFGAFGALAGVLVAGATMPEAGWSVVDWVVRGLLESEWWRLAGGVIVMALAFCGVEMLIRKALGR
jgi:hypothetical protein